VWRPYHTCSGTRTDKKNTCHTLVSIVATCDRVAMISSVPVSKAAFKAAAACDATMTACSSSRVCPLRYWSVKDVLTSASKFPPLASRLHLQWYTCSVDLLVVCYHYYVITTSLAFRFVSIILFRARKWAGQLATLELNKSSKLVCPQYKKCSPTYRWRRALTHCTVLLVLRRC